MKKLIPVILFLFITKISFSQGLENVIVETYYISDANDTIVNADGGVLPVGSVTYRIYADMLPGYRLQAVYGVPGHDMQLQTSTLFFNNEDRGATTPTYTKIHAKGNTVMLDSWLSVGAGCANNYGILKSSDDGVATVVNNDNVLMNNSAAVGIPLTQEDGLIAGTPEPVTIVGISTEIAMFDNQNDGTNGPLFWTDNGSWASLNGSVGPDTVANQVLIAQITTDGIFDFRLNMQIGTPSLGVENYVAQNPVANEILFAPLTFSTISGIDKTAGAPGFLVYPNPANDMVKIKMFNQKDGDVSYRILDIKGAVMMQKQVEGAFANYVATEDVSTLSPGLYFIEVTTEGGKSVSKLVKQ
jgi:hypothetical protein